MGVVLFNKKNKIPHPPVYEFPHTIKLLKYDGSTSEKITEKDYRIYNHCKVEQATKSVYEFNQQTLISGSLIFIPFCFNEIDNGEITLYSKIELPNGEEVTVKTIELTNISGEDYCYEIFVG